MKRKVDELEGYVINLRKNYIDILKILQTVWNKFLEKEELKMYKIIFRVNFEDWLVGEEDIGNVDSIKTAIETFFYSCEGLEVHYKELDEFIEESVFQENLGEEKNKELLDEFIGGFCIEIYRDSNDDFYPIISQYFKYDYLSHTVSTEGITINSEKLNNNDFDVISLMIPSFKKQ